LPGGALAPLIGRSADGLTLRRGLTGRRVSSLAYQLPGGCGGAPH